jgi:hypothetical protein
VWLSRRLCLPGMVTGWLRRPTRRRPLDHGPWSAGTPKGCARLRSEDMLPSPPWRSALHLARHYPPISPSCQDARLFGMCTNLHKARGLSVDGCPASAASARYHWSVTPTPSTASDTDSSHTTTPGAAGTLPPRSHGPPRSPAETTAASPRGPASSSTDADRASGGSQHNAPVRILDRRPLGTALDGHFSERKVARGERALIEVAENAPAAGGSEVA